MGCESPLPADAGVVPVKRIFATSVVYSGDLGGLVGADDKCATVAMAGALGGVWKAWLSSSADNAVDRITDVGPWFLVDGVTKVFNNKINLTTNPIAAINMDENGAYLNGSVWTGTVAGGTKDTINCLDWTDGSTLDVRGRTGLALSQINDARWTYEPGSGAPCSSDFRLYCIEQ
jgi:hypothetical protein